MKNEHNDRDHNEDFLAKCRDIDFSAESLNFESNLEDLKIKFFKKNEEENDIIMENNIQKNKRRSFRKPSFAIAACMAAIMVISVPVFGQNLVNYIRTIALGDHARFIISEEISETERQALMEETQALIDEGVLVVVTEQDFDDIQWLTFTDPEEGKSHFITDVMLPTYSPEGYDFKHIFYFIETLEGLQEYGANMFMGVVFTNGTDEISMQIRYMTEETGFCTGATENMRTLEINGYEAILDVSTLNLLVGDVMYMFFSQGNVNEEALIRMAESLR